MVMPPAGTKVSARVCVYLTALTASPEPRPSELRYLAEPRRSTQASSEPRGGRSRDRLGTRLVESRAQSRKRKAVKAGGDNDAGIDSECFGRAQGLRSVEVQSRVATLFPALRVCPSDLRLSTAV